MDDNKKKAATETVEETPVMDAASAKDNTPKTTAPKPAKCGFCVYLGPSIRAEIQNATIFNVSRDKALKDNAELIARYPLVAALIVPGDETATARIKVATPGYILHVKYMQLAGQLN